MKALTKVIVAGSLGLSAMASQAALIETDYPGSFISNATQKAAPAPMVEYKGAAPFILSNNQAGLVPNPAYKEQATRSIDEVRREARMTRTYTFVNA